MAKSPTSSKRAKKAAGRPRLEFDLQQVEKLAAIQCTDGELAAVLGCSRQTILNRKDDDADFLAAIERGRESGKASLRRLQWKTASAGNTTMLIWLGKQYLCQQDRRQIGHSGQVNGVLVVPAPMKAEEWDKTAREQQEAASTANQGHGATEHRQPRQ